MYVYNKFIAVLFLIKYNKSKLETEMLCSHRMNKENVV